MSDAAIGGPGPERWRALASILAAVALHAGILTVITLAAGLGLPLPAATQTVIDVQLESEPAPAEPIAAEPAPGAAEPSPAGQLSEAPSPSPQAASLPAASSKPVAAAGVGSTSDFVIPTPRGQAANSLPTARGAAFQELGGRTGVAASLPAEQHALPQPDVAVVPQGRTTGSGAASSSGGGTSVQHGGQGTPVPGPAGKGSSENLDMRQLDRTIAGTGTGGSAGSGASKGGSGQGGTGTGQAGSGGTGSGGSGPGSYRGNWDLPDASRGRKLEIDAKPIIPPWVSTQGLTLSVRVAFTLTPAGVIGAVSVVQSTGYSDVDNAVLDAIRFCRFSSTTSTALVKGVFTYVVKPQ